MVTNANYLCLPPTSPAEVLQIINSLKSKNITGHDDISANVLKQI